MKVQLWIDGLFRTLIDESEKEELIRDYRARGWLVQDGGHYINVESPEYQERMRNIARRKKRRRRH